MVDLKNWAYKACSEFSVIIHSLYQNEIVIFLINEDKTCNADSLVVCTGYGNNDTVRVDIHRVPIK